MPFPTFAPMQPARIFFLFFAVTVVLAHATLPHHHHISYLESQQEEDRNHQRGLAIDHHQDDNAGHHDTDSHEYGLFTFNQIGESFVTGKQVIIPFTLAPVIQIFEWDSNQIATQDLNNFSISDIDIPPFLRCLEISFRGPPSIS